MNRKLEFTVPEEYEGKKAFYFLRGCAGISARALSSLKRVDGGITRGGETLRTIDRLHAGDIVTVTLPVETETVEPMDINIDVIYEDADLLAVNKSSFLAMHPTHNHQGDTLANAVAGHLQSEGKSAVFRCVGRLDKGTSGVVVCALNRYAAARLSGNINKRYVAVVRGHFEGERHNKQAYLPPRPDENSARVRRYARERERGNALGEPVFKRRIQPAETHSRNRQNASDKGAFRVHGRTPCGRHNVRCAGK